MDNIPSDQELLDGLSRCGHMIFHSRHGYRQDAVLSLLQENGSMSQKKLQKELKIQPGSASELLSKLEDKGLLARSRDDTDRRAVLVSLTAKGEKTLKIHAAGKELHFAMLSEVEREQLNRLLGKLLSEWDDEREEGEG